MQSCFLQSFPVNQFILTLLRTSLTQQFQKSKVPHPAHFKQFHLQASFKALPALDHFTIYRRDTAQHLRYMSSESPHTNRVIRQAVVKNFIPNLHDYLVWK